MSILSTWIVSASLAGFLILSIVRLFRDRGVIVFGVKIAGVISAVIILYLAFDFPFSSQAKGRFDWNEAYPIVGLYAFMALGMLAQYAYAHFSQPAAKRDAFDWGNFVAPILLSPIVFIPLYASLRTAPQAHASAMSLLIAFQNGFFFKNFVDQKGRQHANAM